MEYNQTENTGVCSATTPHQSKDMSEDVEKVAEITEKALRCIIYRLLERVIEQECELGQLDFSSIHSNIIFELRAMKENMKDYELVDEGTNFDNWLSHKIITIVDLQFGEMLKTYHSTFYKLTVELDLRDEFSFAYNSFVNVCRKLMQNEISWYRIIALLCFGAEIAVFVIKKGGPGVENFVNKIVHYVVEFIVKEEIADWISSHGGWITMINFLDWENCPKRAHHIATIMAIAELTSYEVWFRRILLTTVVCGVGYSIVRKFIDRS